jgi:restriction system protein
MPENIINQGICKYIKYFQKPIITPEDVDQIIVIIEKHLFESTITNKDHINSLQSRHNSNTICPKCG